MRVPLTAKLSPTRHNAPGEHAECDPLPHERLHNAYADNRSGTFVMRNVEPLGALTTSMPDGILSRSTGM